jgi:hypothetical protein
MNRATISFLIAFSLAVFGIYRAVYVPGMLVGPLVPLLLVGFVLQAVFGILAAIGVWRGATWAPFVILLLGGSVAATALFEVLLGVLAPLRALFDAGVAILVTMLMAAYVRRVGSSPGESASTS